MTVAKRLAVALFLVAAIAWSADRTEGFDACAEIIANCPEWAYECGPGGCTFACYPAITCFHVEACLVQECGTNWIMTCDDGPSYGGPEGAFACI